MCVYRRKEKGEIDKIVRRDREGEMEKELRIVPERQWSESS